MARQVGSGRCVPAAAATRARLGADAQTVQTPVAGPDAPIQKLIVRALETNTGVVVIGGSGVVAAAAARNGVALAPTGPPLEFEDIDDLGDLWVDSLVTGEGVSFMWTVR